MFSFTLDIYCTSVRPGRGIPHMWLSLRFLLSFYLLKGFFSSFSLLLLRVKGRGCHTLLKPYEMNCGLWIWAIQIKFDWLIDWHDVCSGIELRISYCLFLYVKDNSAESPDRNLRTSSVSDEMPLHIPKRVQDFQGTFCDFQFDYKCVTASHSFRQWLVLVKLTCWNTYCN